MLPLQSLIQTRETPHQSHLPHPVPPLSREGCVLQTLCQILFSFVIADTNSLISQAFERFPVPSYLLISAFWLNATWAMLTNAASYHNVTILVFRSIFYAHWPVGHSSPAPCTLLSENAALLCFYIRLNRQVDVKSLSNCKYYSPYTFVKACTCNLTKVPGRIWNCCTVWWKNYCCYQCWLGYIALDKSVKQV